MRVPTLLAVARRNGVEDPALLAELAARRTVLDVCPTSNVATGVVAALASHALPALVAAGALCDAATREELRTTGQNAAWPPAPVLAGGSS